MFTTVVYLMVFVKTASSAAWKGSHSTSWEDPENWSSGFVPNEFTNVTIKNSPLNNPIINSNVTIKSLTAEKSSLLKIEKGFRLNIIGDRK